MAGASLTVGSVQPLMAETSKGRIDKESGVYNVRSFGAIGDGKTIDTPAVNRAIEAAAAAGGGTVRFPAGQYLCYSIRMKSNISLYLDQAAVIIAADSPTDGKSAGYDIPEPRQPWEDYQDYGHNHWHDSLIWGESIHDISILGPGRIWGKGLSRGTGGTLKAGTPGVGDKAISLKNCYNVLLKDFQILQGGWFGILATGVDNLVIDGLMIDTNRDGMDIDCCRNVRISNCAVNSPWDDAIVPKSSYALGYNRSTENLTITNCYVTGAYVLGTMLDGTWKKFEPTERIPHTGRIKLGTESNGGFKNITISNCVFEGCQGLALETVDGALLEDIAITNITMRDITSAPIFLRLGSRLRGPEGTKTGVLRRVLIQNIVCSNAVPTFGSIISGVPGFPIEDVKISNVYIQHQGGGTKEQAAIVPEEKESAYPEPRMFGPMPSQAFFLRHVKNIQFSDVQVVSKSPDERPSFVLTDVEDADFFHVQTQESPGVAKFELKQVKNFSVARTKGLKDTEITQAEKQSL